MKLGLQIWPTETMSRSPPPRETKPQQGTNDDHRSVETQHHRVFYASFTCKLWLCAVRRLCIQMLEEIWNADNPDPGVGDDVDVPPYDRVQEKHGRQDGFQIRIG
jgi:hypothetical protein